MAEPLIRALKRPLMEQLGEKHLSDQSKQNWIPLPEGAGREVGMTEGRHRVQQDTAGFSLR